MKQIDSSDVRSPSKSSLKIVPSRGSEKNIRDLSEFARTLHNVNGRIALESSFASGELEPVLIADGQERRTRDAITSAFPDAEIEENGYRTTRTFDPEGYSLAGTYFNLSRSKFEPIKTGKTVEDDGRFKETIASEFSRICADQGIRFAIQVVLHPVSDRWSKNWLDVWRRFDPDREWKSLNDFYAYQAEEEGDTERALRIRERASEPAFRVFPRVFVSAPTPRECEDILSELESRYRNKFRWRDQSLQPKRMRRGVVGRLLYYPAPSKLDKHIKGYAHAEFPSPIRPLKNAGFVLPASEIAGLLPIPIRDDVDGVEYCAGVGYGTKEGPSF